MVIPGKPKFFSGVFLRKLDLKISSSNLIPKEFLHNHDKKSKDYLFTILNNFAFMKSFISLEKGRKKFNLNGLPLTDENW